MKHLTENNIAFGLLSKKRQDEFRAQRDAGATILVYDECGEWVEHGHRFFRNHGVYRVRKVPEA